MAQINLTQGLYGWQVHNHEIAKQKRKFALKMKISAVAGAVIGMERKTYERKRHWVAPICSIRDFHGFYAAILPKLRMDNLGFYNYFRMSATKLEELLAIVGPDLQKQHCIRKPIPAAERLCLTLRYVHNYFKDLEVRLH